MFKMKSERLTELIKLAEKQKTLYQSTRNIIPGKHFIDLLNHDESGVEIIYLNERTTEDCYVHKLEYKGFKFIATTKRKIYNSEDL